MWRRVAGEAAAEISSLGYPPPEGLDVLREAIAAHMEAWGISCTPGQVLVSSGALQALQMISVSLLSAGSTVYAEAPSYIKSLQVFQSAGMKLAGVPMDEQGLDVDALGRLMGGGSQCEGMTAAVPSAPQTSLPPRAKATRENDAVLYTIPTNHNPTGITMSEPRRRALIASCVANRLPIIEDCAYQDLIFDGDTPHTLKSFDETGMVITLGSASKALAPGLRIGWIVADERIVQRLADVKMQMDYGASTLSQWVFARFLSSGLYDEYMVRCACSYAGGGTPHWRRWSDCSPAAPTGTCRAAVFTSGSRSTIRCAQGACSSAQSSTAYCSTPATSTISRETTRCA